MMNPHTRGKNKYNDAIAIAMTPMGRSSVPTLPIPWVPAQNPSINPACQTDSPSLTNTLHYLTLPKPKTFNTTQVQTSEIANPSSPAHLPLPPFIGRLDVSVRIVSDVRRLPVCRWAIVGLRSPVDRVRLGCVVLFVRVAARGLLGLGFLVEAVAQGDAHFRRGWRWRGLGFM